MIPYQYIEMTYWAIGLGAIFGTIFGMLWRISSWIFR